ncbi:MAG TPA: bifunctional DNA-binding transcriptional regulator/O6-methylguanine-DNA methyltransferase Ada [Pyrinomonadaceae bacterium]|nr:bifunctional DNA-binding transcriptional regulator/O6-methylguanine-DNA methyltransferase Ada [Pyrinomonadaceae bacterium]
MTRIISTETQSNEWRWHIVETKNAEFDGAFFFGVSSTGIYCKPSCASRRPKRENTRFFASCSEAESEGFRACLRCRPQAENTRSTNAEIVMQACRIIENKFDDDISLESLAAELNVSPSHLQRTFKQTLGISPKEFAGMQRLNNFKKEVRQSDVTTAMYGSGFGSSRALYEKATQNLGMTPATYRKGGRNLDISYATAESSLGKMLVAATERGVCAVAFGETEEQLEANLAREFPAAKLQPDEGSLQTHVRAIIAYLDGQRRTLDLPLDLQATAFQLQVWTELRRIPYGETRSYKEIAESIGNAKAVRAVARACASNPVALVNPCHRVVGANGALSGYRWGVERKKILLEREQSTGER